jgi:hypothetical protein
MSSASRAAIAPPANTKIQPFTIAPLRYQLLVLFDQALGGSLGLDKLPGLNLSLEQLVELGGGASRYLLETCCSM